ncbi:MAG TPA: GNAT family N-acetyltransferase [Ilumatobacteraceae bacterium]
MPELSIIEQPLLDRYAPAWDALVDQAPLPTPFLRSWWLEHTSSGRPVFVLVLDGEVLIGGIALQEEQRPGGARLRFMGNGPLCPDHLDLLAAPGREAEVVGALRMALAERDPAIVDLDGLCADALVTGCFDARAVMSTAASPYLVLDGTAPLAGRSSRVRNTVQRTTKRLAKLGVVPQVVPPDGADRAFEALRSLHNERWGDESQFLPAIDRFEAAARIGLRRGELVIHEMAVTEGTVERVVAVCVVLYVAGRASYYQAGRLTDPEWRGAGTAVLAASVEAAAAAGCHEYDLLRGSEPYKQDWSSGHRDVYRLVAEVGGRRAGASLLAASIDARQRSRPYVHRARAFVHRNRSRFLTPAGERGGERS